MLMLHFETDKKSFFQTLQNTTLTTGRELDQAVLDCLATFERDNKSEIKNAKEKLKSKSIYPRKFGGKVT